MAEYVDHQLVKKNKVQKRLYQELLTAKAIDKNTLVVAPTGLGKTIIAVLVIAYTYNKDKSILLLSPTKPLITQHYKSLIDLLDIPKEKIILLTGEIDPKKRKDLYKEKGIIICATPQTIDNDLNNNYIDSENFNLIIFDEAHRATKNYAYCNISKYFENDLKRLALTASPGFNKQKIEDVANNLKIDHIEIRTESDVDVVDYVKDVDIDTKYIDLDIHSKKIASLIDQLISKKIDLLQKFGFKLTTNFSKKQILEIQKSIFARINDSKKNPINFIAISQITQITKILHAKELIETQGFFSFQNYMNKLILESKQVSASKSIKQLINSTEFIEIKNYLEKNKDKLKYNKEEELLKILKEFIKKNPKSKILVFSNFRDNANHLVNLINKSKDIKSVRFVGQATKTNDKGLSQKEQIKIISEFKEDKYNCLVCTSVGEEGLDIPSVDLVLFYDSVPSEIRNIQRRGRTGRFNVGKVILLINKDTIDEKYYFVSQNKEKKMKKYLSNYNYIKTSKKKEQKTILDF